MSRRLPYHEGVPGHHLQFSIAQELTGLPPFRKYNLDLNAFTEGWAFYSERLGKRSASIKTRTATTDVCKTKCGAPCAG